MSPPTTEHVDSPEYFDSLADLATYCTSPRVINCHAAPKVPLELSPTPNGGSRLYVCHDYKGGYTERPDERGYTFAWWHLTDVFIYFSHHRVSLPPPSWIRTAHRHGTKILGTLIFEWDAGKEDILNLVMVDNGKVRSFDPVRTDVADHLVDLAVERGFDGYLVNVEVELGGEGRRAVDAHVQALLVWLAYLRREVARRVPHGEVMWYDGVTNEGAVRWQNALTSSNASFFLQVDSIFLNYFWRSSSIANTLSTLETLPRRLRRDVAFGLDVWGRGQFGGGGFHSYVSMDLLEGAASQQFGTDLAHVDNTSATTDDFSVALFAPAWTVESEHLNHSLSTQAGYRRWWDDELYLWAGARPTANVSSEATRNDKVRKEERGVHRALHLAAALSNGVSAPPLPPFAFNSPLPPLPGVPRPITAYRSSRPPPAPAATFFTTFATGSGHSFFVDGVKEYTSPNGWTDVDYTWPFPSLLLPSVARGPEGSFEEDDAWLGPTSLRVRSQQNNSPIPICATAVPLHGDVPLVATIVWKPASTASLTLAIRFNSYYRQDESCSVLEEHTIDLAAGWRRTQALVVAASSNSATISSLGILISSAPSSSSSSSSSTDVLLGAISLAPSRLSQLPAPIVTGVSRATPTSTRWVWQVSRVRGSSSSTNGVDNISHHAVPWPRYLFFTVWDVGEGRKELLGWTTATEFSGAESVTAVAVRGVKEDGSLDDAVEASRIDEK